MPYEFEFDLSKLPNSVFNEIAKISYQRGIHRNLANKLQEINATFNLSELLGININEVTSVLADLIDLQAINALEREAFQKTKKRALLLPHCSRKYMDSRSCKAYFDADIPTYQCAQCSNDCTVNQAQKLAKEKGYDVYILPGGSCISKILQKYGYEGIVGAACGAEIKVLGPLLKSMGVAYQTVPLLKNGCANTVFNISSLTKVL
jgi:hypothetical protein